MGLPAFQFAAVVAPDEPADAQFWRDVEVAERLGSGVAATFFLRELCRTKALADAGVLDSHGRIAFFYERERDLVRQLEARGFRLATEPATYSTMSLGRTG